MALYINTNVSSMIAQNSLSRVDQSLGQNQERLSTGLRINSAADDAAGLAISNNFSAQIRGMNQATRNGNDGISFVQTAEGATKEITENLQRMRELAVQSANGLYSSGEGQGRLELQDEFVELQNEITRIADNTTFNGSQMITGTGATNAIGDEVSFQVGANTTDSDKITLSLADSVGNMRASGGLLGVDSGNIDIKEEANAEDAIAAIDDALINVNSLRSNLGAVQNRLGAAVSNLENAVENATESRSRLQDADIAKEAAELTQNNVLRQAATAMLSQANQNPQLALQLLGGGA